MPTRRRLLSLAAAVVLLAAACGDGGAPSPTVTPTLEPTATAAPTATADTTDLEQQAVAVEADDDPSLPGEYVDLPAIYGAPYPYGTPPPHQEGPIDYSAQGLPPVGGLHWGPSPSWPGPCPPDPDDAVPNCGPVPWGIYRTPWPAEALVHNMEHAGVVIWYNTTDQAVIDDLEAFTEEQLAADKQIVLAPYPDMEAETVAVTIWSRRDLFPASEYDRDRLQRFIDVLYCRFDPEGFCPH